MHHSRSACNLRQYCVVENKENVPPDFKIHKRSNSLPARIFDNPFGWKRRKEINQIDSKNFSRAVRWLKTVLRRQDQFERILKRHDMMGTWFPNYYLRSNSTVEIGNDYILRTFIGSEGILIIKIVLFRIAYFSQKNAFV